MRLFVALNLPDHVRESLAEHIAPRRQVPEGPRWSDPEHWHITLGFMPSVEDWRLDGLLERLSDVAERHHPVDLALRGAGAFPGPEDAKVLWVGVHDGVEELAHLAQGMRGACNDAGAEPTGGRFRAHITVGRFGRPVEATRWIRVLDTFEGATWTADEIDLVESHLGEGRGRRPRHEVRATFPLGTRPSS